MTCPLNPELKICILVQTTIVIVKPGSKAEVLTTAMA